MPPRKREDWLDERSSLRSDLGVRARSVGELVSSRSVAGDPLAELREIRVPPEGVKTLGLPDAPPEPPPLEPVEEKLGWFQVTVVDAWGEPVGGLDLEVSYQGTRKKVRTPANGQVRVDGVSASFGAVSFVDVPAARDVVRPRWAKKKQPDSAPEVENPAVVALAPDLGPTSLTSEKPLTIVLVKSLPRVRLIGMHFDTNKSFMRPTAVRGIRAVVTELEKSPTGHLLIVGHTDSVGGDVENLGLSVDRAEAVKAYLQNDVAAWEVWYGEGKETKTRWGDRETTQMLSALPCEQSISGFQTFSNETRGTALKVDGIFGPVTRRELIKAYMELGGTTLPAHIGIEVHGCGEFFPVDDVGDNAEDQENRRVEMYCFDDEIEPPVPGKRAKKGEPEYDQWKKQVTKTIDVDTEPLVDVFVRVLDRNHRPMKHVGCRASWGTGQQHRDVTNGEGIFAVLLPKSTSSFVVEWGEPQEKAVNEFLFRQTVVRPMDETDEALAQRLANTGMRDAGDDVKDAVRRYQRTFAHAETGMLSDVRKELLAWHDDGVDPVGAAGSGV